MSSTQFEISREDRWVYTLFLTMILLLSVLVCLNRSPLCIDSSHVESTRFTFDRGVAQVFSCSSRLSVKEKGEFSYSELSRAVEAHNKALRLVETEFANDPTLIRPGKRAQLTLKSTEAGRVETLVDAWFGRSRSLLQEFRRSRAFGFPSERQQFWESPSEWRTLALRELMELIPRPLVGHDLGLVQYYLRAIDTLIQHQGENLSGQQCFSDPSYQRNHNDVAQFREALRRIRIYSETTGNSWAQRLSQVWEERLEVVGLSTEPQPLIVRTVVWIDQMRRDHVEALKVAIKDSPRDFALADGESVFLNGQKWERAQLPRLRSAEVVDVYCGEMNLQRVRLLSQSSFRTLLLEICPDSAGHFPLVRWQPLIHRDVQWFSEANPELPFLHLNSGYLLSKLESKAATEKSFQVEDRDLVLAYRFSKVLSR